MSNPRHLLSNYRLYHFKKAQTRKKTVQASEDIMFQLVKRKCSDKLFNHYGQVTPQSTNKAYNVLTHITYKLAFLPTESTTFIDPYFNEFNKTIMAV